MPYECAQSLDLYRILMPFSMTKGTLGCPETCPSTRVGVKTRGGSNGPSSSLWGDMIGLSECKSRSIGIHVQCERLPMSSIIDEAYLWVECGLHHVAKHEDDSNNNFHIGVII